MSNSCSPLCRAKAGTRARRPAKATAGFASVLQLARLGVPTQLRELRIQTRPTRLSGSLEGLACCSPPSRPPGRPIAFELHTARARVRTLRRAHIHRRWTVSNASADWHLLYASSEGARAQKHKKKGAAYARAQRAQRAAAAAL